LHDTLPPAPGVALVALASTVPAIVAFPNTAKMTGRDPVTRIVEPSATVTFLIGRTTTSGPPGCVRTIGVGSF
jgi:hypothetical protein